ncbi:MAG: choice-of-anchor D domain-containing protein, partial [Bacteroidota bacterium]|nr:choice-of-anchor D domain-containing protein [Bacteroidota bacterium]
MHTDTLVAGSPWRIAYSVVKDSILFRLTDGSVSLRRHDFGTLCPGEQRTMRAVVVNTSGRLLRFAVPRLVNAAYWSVTPASAFALLPGGQQILTVQCQGNFVGAARGALIVESAECPHADTVELLAFGLQTQLEWRGSGQFGFVRVGSSSELTVVLRNIGYSAAWIPEAPTVAPPFQLVGTHPPIPTQIAPYRELEFRLRYAPVAARADAAELTVLAVRGDSTCPDTTRLLLSGTGVKVGVRASPVVVDFGPVSRCEMPLDTVWLVNVGTVPIEVLRPAQLVGPEASDFVVVAQPSTPSVIAPGDSVSYIVQLMPAAGTGIRSAQMVLTTSDTAEPYVTVGLRAERVTPFVAMPPVVDIGTIRQGQVAQATVTGRNLLLRPLTIRMVRSSHPDVTVTPQSADIPASASQPFTITVSPQRLGVLRAELLFIVTEPCLDTQRVLVYGSVTGEGIAHSSLIDFGTVVFCQERTDTLAISNGTADTLWLLSAAINGADASVFTADFPPLPVGIAPGEVARYAVRFHPVGATDGQKQAQLELTVRAGLEVLRLEVLLLGRRETPLLSAPLQVFFGNVLLGAAARQPLVVNNRGARTIRIDTAWLQDGRSFSIVLQPVFPSVLAPSESLTFIVEFQPQHVAIFTDTLRLRMSHPCADERVIALAGSGIAPIMTRVWLPDTQASPWDQNVRIPLRFMPNPEGAQLSTHWAELEIAYDPSIFLLRGVSRGRILRYGSVGGLATVALRVEDIPISTGGTVTELIGDVLLGSQAETPLRILNFLWNDGLLSSQTRREDGRLRLMGICNEGGARLLRPVGLAMVTAESDPGQLRVITLAGERGTYALELYS